MDHLSDEPDFEPSSHAVARHISAVYMTVWWLFDLHINAWITFNSLCKAKKVIFMRSRITFQIVKFYVKC